MSQLQLWNLSESGLWKWSHCCSGEVLLFLDFPTFPKESPRSSHSSLGAAASLLSLPAVALAVLHPSSPFPARSLGHHSGMWVFQTLAVPLCWSGLWECSTEVFRKGRMGRVGLAGSAFPPVHTCRSLALPFWQEPSSSPLLRPPPRGKSVLTLGLNTSALTNVPPISSRASSPGKRSPDSWAQ